jgi:hypothetical protein
VADTNRPAKSRPVSARGKGKTEAGQEGPDNEAERDDTGLAKKAGGTKKKGGKATNKKAALSAGKVVKSTAREPRLRNRPKAS